jgi:8-oxo-dGTP pyrophosphatase MutT (NUDIX family)
MSSSSTLAHLNAAARPRTTKNLRPRDAASIVLIDNTGAKPRMLIGKRHPDQVFLPNKFVFPGGRVDPSDTRLKVGDALSALEEQKLLLAMKGRPIASRARGLALAAIRELFEETGVLIGDPHDGAMTTSAPGWQDFLRLGYVPKIRTLTYFARALTPPRRPRRYDTRFFVAMASEIAHQSTNADDELSNLDWLTFDEARSCDLHAMTRTIVDEVETLLDARHQPKRRKSVPFYYEKHGIFCRVLLKAS